MLLKSPDHSMASRGRKGQRRGAPEARIMKNGESIMGARRKERRKRNGPVVPLF
jgi:hypothetical protein